jgi:hypothetical protein
LVLAISVMLGVSGCGTLATFFNGPADATTTTHIAAQITTALKQQGAPGSISGLTARHFGHGLGGIEVHFTYTETVNGMPVSVPIAQDGLTFGDDGEYRDGSLETAVRNAIVRANPFTTYPGYTTLRDSDIASVRQALGVSQVGRMTVTARFQDAPLELGMDQSWFDQTSATNLKSQDPKARAFFGYYDIPPQQALSHLTLGIDFKDDSPAMQDANREYSAGNCAAVQSLLDEDWTQLISLIAGMNTKTLPDDTYQANLETTTTDATDRQVTGLSAQSASFRFADGHPTPTNAFDKATLVCNPAPSPSIPSTVRNAHDRQMGRA